MSPPPLISFEDCRKHFHLPVEEAAQKLGVSRPTISRVMRQNRIKRWPFRFVQATARRAKSEPGVRRNAEVVQTTRRTRSAPLRGAGSRGLSSDDVVQAVSNSLGGNANRKGIEEGKMLEGEILTDDFIEDAVTRSVQTRSNRRRRLQARRLSNKRKDGDILISKLRRSSRRGGDIRTQGSRLEVNNISGYEDETGRPAAIAAREGDNEVLVLGSSDETFEFMHGNDKKEAKGDLSTVLVRKRSRGSRSILTKPPKVQRRNRVTRREKTTEKPEDLLQFGPVDLGLVEQIRSHEDERMKMLKVSEEKVMTPGGALGWLSSEKAEKLLSSGNLSRPEDAVIAKRELQEEYEALGLKYPEEDEVMDPLFEDNLHNGFGLFV